VLIIQEIGFTAYMFHFNSLNYVLFSHDELFRTKFLKISKK